MFVTDAIADEFLFQNARRGDEESFARLYERYRDEIFSFVYRVFGSTALAEAITHDCFLRLMRESAPEVSEGTGRIPLYLYSTAHDLAMEHALDSDQQSIPINLGRDGAHTGHEAAIQMVSEAIGSLPLFEREILILTEYHGMETDEIAAVVKVDRHNVAESLATARRRLRAILANHLSKDSFN